MDAHGHDIDGQDLDQRFARFGLRPLTDAEVWALSMATMVLPDGSPGPEGYLSKVSGTTLFASRLMEWGMGVAAGISKAGYMARNGRRRRAYVEGYDPAWGRYAVADGLTLAMYGCAADETKRASQNHQGYIRIRDFVGGALLSAITEFVMALEWATGKRRDRVLEGRWEAITGLNYRESLADATMGYPRTHYVVMAPGCGRIVPLKDQAEAYEQQPETLYPAIRPSSCWDERQAAEAQPVKIVYAPPRKIPPRC